ncbi:MAG: hypothetical protein RRY07_09185 [Bacteroidaceae bacterium]
MTRGGTVSIKARKRRMMTLRERKTSYVMVDFCLKTHRSGSALAAKGWTPWNTP